LYSTRPHLAGICLCSAPITCSCHEFEAATARAGHLQKLVRWRQASLAAQAMQEGEERMQVVAADQQRHRAKTMQRRRDRALAKARRQYQAEVARLETAGVDVSEVLCRTARQQLEPDGGSQLEPEPETELEPEPEPELEPETEPETEPEPEPETEPETEPEPEPEPEPETEPEPEPEPAREAAAEAEDAQRRSGKRWDAQRRSGKRREEKRLHAFLNSPQHAQLLQELHSLSLGGDAPLAELRKRAMAEGVLRAEIERAQNGRKPWDSMVTLIVERVASRYTPLYHI
jgi:outer membrane biosynthesis protein TonB